MKKITKLFALVVLLILVNILVLGSGKNTLPKKTRPRPATAKITSTTSPAARQNLPTEQIMSTSQPQIVNWADISGKAPLPIKEGEDDSEYIESDIDPATLQLLKRKPFSPPASVPSSYSAVQDTAVKNGKQEAPLAPNLLVNFESIDDGDQLDGFLHRPPDCAMTAGLNHVISAVNSMFVIYTKAGVNVGQASFASFFAPVCSGCSPFDPRVAYDNQANRWILITVNGSSSTPNVSNYLVAVSQTSDPTGTWWLYSLSGLLTYPSTGENTWADFPQLGFDGIPAASGGAIYITSNQFTFGAASFRTAMLNILPKSSLYSGASLNYWRAWDRLNSNGSQAFALSPSLTYGNPGAEYMVNTQNTGNFISVWKVIPTFPPTAINWTLQSTNTIGAYAIPPDATQPGNCALMATNDSRISSNAVWQNNKIYATFSESFDWGGGGGTVSAIRIFQIDTSTNATDQNFTFGADGAHYFFPALAVDGSNNLVVTFARANSAEFGNVRFTGRLATEPVNTLQASASLKSGNLCITGNRWGDYFAAAVDPADTSKVWVYGAWAADVPGVSLPWDWGTWVGQVQFPQPTPCPTVSSISPTSGPVGTNVTITGNNFTGVSAVKFSTNVNASFTVNSNTQITATVPAGAVTGPITISKPSCTDVQTGTFTVTTSNCISVSISTSLSGPAGSLVTVPIVVSNINAAQGVTAYDFVLTFNSSIVTPASPAFDTAGTLSSGMTITPNVGVSGQITLSAFGTTPLSGSGVLLNLKFNVNANATVGACSNLNWTSFTFNEGTPCSTTANGQVCVVGGTISGTVNYCIGTPVKTVPGVTLTAAGTPSGMFTTGSNGVYQIAGLGGGPYTVTPTKTGAVNGISSFDASLVAQAAAGIITLTSCQQIGADVSNNGTVSSFDASLIAQTVAGIPNSGIAGTWKFVPNNRSYPTLSGNQVNQNYDAILVGDVSGNWTPAAPLAPPGNTASQVSVYLSPPVTATDTTLEVPIMVSNLTGRKVVSYDFAITFDPNLLQPQGQSIDTRNTLSSGMTITFNSRTPGRLVVSAFGIRPLSGSGPLLKVKFNMNGHTTADANLNIQGFVFNEGMPAANVLRRKGD